MHPRTYTPLIVDNDEHYVYYNHVNESNFVEVMTTGSPLTKGVKYLAVFYNKDLVYGVPVDERSFLEIEFIAKNFDAMVSFVRRLLGVVIVNSHIFTCIVEWLTEKPQDGIGLITFNDIEGYDIISSWDFINEKSQFIYGSAKEGKTTTYATINNEEEEEIMIEEKYELDLLVEETGEFIGTVKVDQDVIEALIERGFREVLKDQIKATEPMFEIDRVIFNDPATIILWSNGDKTVVKTMEDDVYQPEVGFAMAYAKYAFGSRTSLMKYVKQWLPAAKEVSETQLQFDLPVLPKECPDYEFDTAVYQKMDNEEIDELLYNADQKTFSKDFNNIKL